MGHLSKQWTLKSLTIGPQIHETDAQFWEESFKGLPPLPGVDNVTIIYNYPTVEAFNTDCWEYFDRLLARPDLFPSLKLVYIQPSIRSKKIGYSKWRTIYYGALRTIQSRGLMPCKLFTFG
jgi:hypothetical protein